MSAGRIMVVEDDLTLSAGLCFELDMNGYLTVAAYNIKKARQLAGEDDFDQGADDYVTKPFSMKILLKRVEAALRHAGGRETAPKDRWEDGFLCLDFAALTARRGQEQIAITPNEYKLLRTLTENGGNVLTRQTLLGKLWDSEGNYIDDHTLTVTMNRLRAKIEDGEHTYIKTVRGMGYIWTGGR